MKNRSVKLTVNNDLCIGCGVCPSICPHQAIHMKVNKFRKVAFVDKKLCTNCGICLKVCSGISVYEDGLDSNYNILDFINKFPIKKCFNLSSKDEDLLIKAQSGGAISDFIIQSMESGEYEGAFLAPSEDLKYSDKTLELYKKTEDVLNAAGSKYVVYSVENIIPYIGSEKKYILVAIPCHIQSIKKFCEVKKLDDSNILYFGLFCDQILNYAIIDVFRKKLLDKDRELVKFSYRGKTADGWPGKLEFLYSDGVESFDSKHRMYLKRFLQLNRCYYCGDKLNKYCDISFGDCYIQGETSSKGKSNIIIRTQEGMNFFSKLDLTRLNICEVEYDEISKSQQYLKKQKNIFDSLFLPNNINLYSGLRRQYRKKDSSFFVYKKDRFFFKLCRTRLMVLLLGILSLKNLKRLHQLSDIIGNIFVRILG